MRRNTVLFIILLVATLTGFLLSSLLAMWIIFRVVIAVNVLAIISLLALSLMKKKPASYDDISRELFKEINRDIQTIYRQICYIEQEDLRRQLELICKDTLVLLTKVTEKSPESRISTGKFIRGNLDFIVQDILPQYIEMQDSPRYYESPGKTMAEGRKAIETYARFLNRQIANLEIADEMRYRVAIEMLGALENYADKKSSTTGKVVAQNV